MNILAIDTSNQMLGVAIIKNDIVVCEQMTNVAKNHSVRLMPAIEQLMAEVSLLPEQLDQIVVAKGPGSYTGVRIGLTVAKTMAWALNIPVIGVSSLEALAYQGRLHNGYICPFFDARRGLVFTGLYQWENNKIEQVKADCNMLMTDWLEGLNKLGKDVLFLSSDVAVYQDVIKEVMGDAAVFANTAFNYTSPAQLAIAGMKQAPDELHLLAPNYLRLAEAEANWLKKQEELKDNG